jgi:hypothetical protein
MSLKDTPREHLEYSMARLEKRIREYPERHGRTAPPWDIEKLDCIYRELDRRDGLLDDNYQLIIPQEI